MENKTFKKYYLFSLLGILLASFYPIYMGITVALDMLRYGTVQAEDYPKYIIPYTPIAFALIVGVAILPLCLRLSKKHAVWIGTGISTVLFFSAELLLERCVTVTRTVTGLVSNLEDWQMYMCYVPKEVFVEKTWTEVDILMGEYSPAFKMHFYLISVVLIISVLNCFYGFAHMIIAKHTGRRKALILQSVASAAFLAMCIWACFTAFYRNGDIEVSPLSAVLMCVFFVLFGVTVGIYAVSFTLGKKKGLSIELPSALASLTTLLMYIGEMILLDGHLYRFGKGFFFQEISHIVLAPIDILIILCAGGVTACIALLVQKRRPL